MVRPLLASDAGTQPALLPVDARDLLPPGHRVWHYLQIVGELDLSAFTAAYRSDGVGRPPYDPAVMVTLLLYCASKGIHTGRTIAEACHDDLGARVITANHHPDESTIDRFVDRHRQALQGLLVQSLRLCDAAGLIDLSLIACDGTKMNANAALSANRTEPTLRAKIATLTTRLAECEAAWAAEIADTDEQTPLFGPAPHPTGGATWQRMHRAARALHTHQRALHQLLANPSTDHTTWQERLERDTARVTAAQTRLATTRAQITAANDARAARKAAGERIPGRDPVPVEDHSRVRNAAASLAKATARARKTAAAKPHDTINTTDPSSAIMPAKHGGFGQLFNVQAAACPSQVILAIGRHPNANDKRALTALLKAVRTNCDAAGITHPIGTALFDNGYASDENFTADIAVDNLLVAVTRDTPTTRQRATPDTPAWQAMADRLDQPANKAAYRRRAAIIEPVFAQLFTQFSNDLTQRGDAVDTQLHLWATSHNLAKLIRHRTATSP